jgi:predicted neuraminidase
MNPDLVRRLLPQRQQRRAAQSGSCPQLLTARLRLPVLSIVSALLATGGLAIAAAPQQPPAVLAREFIAGALPTPSCHASTIAEAEPGQLVAAWFGGQREGADDVGIWVSRQAADGWTQPVEVAVWKEPDGSQQPCWNPVLFRLEDGRLALYYKASGNPRTWKGLVRYSADAGRTWSEPEPLRGADAAHASLSGVPVGPVKNKPVRLADGTLLAGSSTEDQGWRVHFERSIDGGKTWQVIGPVNDGQAIGAIQPSILKLGDGRLLAVGRTRDSRRIFCIESPDNGVTWGAMSLTELPNPNSGTDAVTLADGRHLLVYNHTEKGRSPLNVAVSENGSAWRNVLTLEDSPGEYSYPAIIQSADGLVHVSYTWKRKKIAHVVIDPRQLSGASAAADTPSETVPGS